MSRERWRAIVETVGVIAFAAWAAATFDGCTPQHQAIVDTTCDAARRVCTYVDSVCDVAATSGSEAP